MPRSYKLEICLDSPESAFIAQEAGADRVELCADLYDGGITPSSGMMKLTRQLIHIPLHVIIRPRGGDFCYSDIEFATMKADILEAKEAGVNGVVLGILKPDGVVDIERTKELIALARPMSVTFHRAFDMTLDPRQALEDVITSGADRLLTSGQQKTALEGKELICEFVEKAGSRIIIMPGAGINEGNIAHLFNATHAHEFHMSANIIIPSKMQFKPSHLALGSSHVLSEYEIIRTDPEKVKKLTECE
jgi:copper homeostasis protein